MNSLFYLAMMLFAGLLFGRLAKFCKLPNVTGYLMAGLVMGPFVLGVIPHEFVEQTGMISDMALGFIAFSIGNEFKISYFKRVGFTPIVIALLEALLAVVFVTLALIATGHDVAFSIVLGAIAAATAPAATVMVIKQYKAKGPVTETLMSVVALDDAVCLIAFGFAVAIAKAITAVGDVSFGMAMLKPVVEVGGSLLVGVTLGVLFTFPLKWFHKPSNRLSIVIGFVFLGVGLANYLHLSSLLLCMAMGGMFTNVYRASESIMKLADQITPPLFMLFFVVSGAELDLAVLPTIGVVGIVYILVRVVGKMTGAYVGAKLMHAPKEVQKYLGPTLIPQAGVAIGLSLMAETVVPEYAASIRAVVLCATFVYEIFGPAISKMSLEKAGEIQSEGKVAKVAIDIQS
ncbi:MAG: cation:proton antiporter [Cellulosilyticaceae bacterium]